MSLEGSPAWDPTGEEGHIECCTVRNLHELETVREFWDSSGGSRDSDLDFFSGIVRSRGADCQPHVIVLTRNGEPESILVGLREQRSFPLKLGFLTVFQRPVDVLEFVRGGLRGVASKQNCLFLIREVMRSLKHGEADLALLRQLDLTSPLYDHAIRLPSFVSRDHSRLTDQRWFMNFPRGLDAFLLNLGRSQRSKLRRKYKKVASQFSGNAQVRCFRCVADLPRAVADMERIARKTNKRRFGLGFFGTEQAQHQMAVKAAQGWLRIYILYLDGSPVAFWMGTLYRGCLQADHVGYDLAWSKISPGVFLFLSILEDLRDEEVTTVDFGCGDTQLKKCFGCRPDDRSRESTVHIYARSLRGLQLSLLCTLTDRTTVLFRQLDWLKWGRKTLWRHIARQHRKVLATEERESREAQSEIATPSLK